MIYACTALGALGLGIIAVAPDVNVATVGAAIFGASQGTFLAVDWALMTDIIPKAVVGPVHGPLERRHGVVHDDRGRDRRDHDRPAQQVARRRRRDRIELVFGMVYFLLGAFALRPVVEPDRAPVRCRHARPRSHLEPQNSLTPPVDGARRVAAPRAATSTGAASGTDPPGGRATGRRPTGRRGSRGGPGAPRTRTTPATG